MPGAEAAPICAVSFAAPVTRNGWTLIWSGKGFERLLQLHLEPALAQHAAGETHPQPAIAHLPVFNALAAHVGHGEPGLRCQFERVDAGFFDVEREAVGNHQPRFFEPRVDAVGDVDDRFDGFEPERQREGTGIETIGGHGVVRRVDLAQTGERVDFHEHVLGGNRQRAGFAFHVQRLRRVQGGRHGGVGRSDGLFGVKREVVGVLNRLDEFDGQRLMIAFARPCASRGFGRLPDA